MNFYVKKRKAFISKRFINFILVFLALSVGIPQCVSGETFRFEKDGIQMSLPFEFQEKHDRNAKTFKNSARKNSEEIEWIVLLESIKLSKPLYISIMKADFMVDEKEGRTLENVIIAKKGWLENLIAQGNLKSWKEPRKISLGGVEGVISEANIRRQGYMISIQIFCRNHSWGISFLGTTASIPVNRTRIEQIIKSITFTSCD